MLRATYRGAEHIEVSAQAAASSDLTEKQKALQLEQERLAAANKALSAQQKSLATDQTALRQDQTATSQKVDVVQKLLDGVILPVTEDPNSWVLRVAAVPMQQQQFCRIVDQFHDRLGEVYETRNDIKKNSMYRDCQLSMAALLPGGEFRQLGRSGQRGHTGAGRQRGRNAPTPVPCHAGIGCVPEERIEDHRDHPAEFSDLPGTRTGQRQRFRRRVRQNPLRAGQ